MKNFEIIAIIVLYSQFGLAQEKDSLTSNQLQEVVITGQYNPQSVDKSVFEVNVITASEIKRMAGNNLADVLNQTLNMTIIPQAGEGQSEVEMFGFGGEYVKILVDGIPMIGAEGFGNAIDITQINLDDIKQIEIISGAMGVQYGANAVSGVINIITKKSADSPWEISAYVQEETVGDEYALFDEGRHIQSLELGHKFSDRIYANVLYTRNDFQGFMNQHQGIHYFNKNKPNDGLRGYEWLPKEQNNLKTLLTYAGNGYRVFYKFGYFHELTNKYAENVILNPNSATQTVNPTATDEVYRSERFYHHLNSSGKIGQQVNFNISLSYQEQVKNVETYTYALKTQEKSNIEKQDFNTRKGYFSRGTFSNFFNRSNFDFQVGYAVTIDEGSSQGLAAQSTQKNAKINTLNAYSFFASSEIKINDRLSFRPGARVMASSQFGPQYLASFSGKYKFDSGYQLRLIAGTTPKLPNFEQLYFYMVDANHNIQGNENLEPEIGKSLFLHFKKTYWFNDYNIKYQPKFSVWYLDVKDKIDLIVVDDSPLTYRYNNIDWYRTWGFSWKNKLVFDRFQAGIGAAFSGHSKVLNAAEVTNNDYLYRFQLNARVAYQIPKWHTYLAAFYKYTGPEYQFVQRIDGQGNPYVEKGKLSAFSWLNASVRKSFFNNRFELTLGARNLLDVTAVSTSIGNNSLVGHSGQAQTRTLGYGRSYFIKLLFNLNF